MKNIIIFCTNAVMLAFIACSNPPSVDTLPPDDGSATAAAVNNFFTATSSQDITKLNEMLHTDFRSHHYPAPPGSDKAAFLKGMQDLFTGFPDISTTTLDQIAEGDKVFTYFSWTGTHSGAYMGIEPTGKQVKVEGMDIWRVQDGKLIENWVVMDGMGLMMQLGVVPPPDGAQTAEQ